MRRPEDGVTTLNVMAEHIAALENDIDVSQLSSSQRKRVYIGLYQCHLPKMDEYGVIDFQKNRGIITLKNTTQLESYLPNEDGEGQGYDGFGQYVLEVNRGWTAERGIEAGDEVRFEL
jgi:hypothetical protein